MAREIVTSENRDEYMAKKLAQKEPISKEEEKTLRLYHGTHEKHIEKILKEGLKSPEHLQHSAKWYMLVDNPEAAKAFGEHVLQVDLPYDAVKQKKLWPGSEASYGKQYALRETVHPKHIKKIDSSKVVAKDFSKK